MLIRRGCSGFAGILGGGDDTETGVLFTTSTVSVKFIDPVLTGSTDSNWNTVCLFSMSDNRILLQFIDVATSIMFFILLLLLILF